MKRIIFLSSLLIIVSGYLTYSIELQYKYDKKIFLIFNTRSNFTHYYNGEFLKKVQTLQVSSIETLKVTNNWSKLLLTSYFMEDTDDLVKGYKKSTNKEFYLIKKDKYGRTFGFRDQIGIYDFPVFPDYDINYGETWNHDAEFILSIFNEDMTDIRLNTDVHYQFTGIQKMIVDGKERNIALITAYAVIVYDDPQEFLYFSYIEKLAGFIKFNIRFDIEEGRLLSIDETFDYTTMLYDNSIIDTYGQSGTKYQVSRVFSEIEVEEIKEETKEDKEIKVELKDDKSISITIGKLQFKPDTAVLLEGESKRLDEIALILAKKYRFNNIIILGHTAFTGDIKEQNRLSEERAKSIVEYFIEKYNFDKDLITYKGMGAENPIADNLTEAGRSKNRRVEIIVLPKQD